MSNWLESFEETRALKSLVLDPDVSPYAIFQAFDVLGFYPSLDGKIPSRVKDTNFFNHFEAKIDNNKIRFRVSELRRTWETAYLLTSVYNARQHTNVTAQLCIDGRLNERGLGRDNQPDRAHQTEKFDKWRTRLHNAQFWDCNTSKGMRMHRHFETAAKLLTTTNTSMHAWDDARNNALPIVIGHSKWLTTFLTDTQSPIQMVYPGQSKPKHAARNNTDVHLQTVPRIDDFLTTFGMPEDAFKGCKVEFAHLAPRGRCCLDNAFTVVSTKKKKAKPGSGQVLLLDAAGFASYVART